MRKGLAKAQGEESNRAGEGGKLDIYAGLLSPHKVLFLDNALKRSVNITSWKKDLQDTQLTAQCDCRCFHQRGLITTVCTLRISTYNRSSTCYTQHKLGTLNCNPNQFWKHLAVLQFWKDIQGCGPKPNIHHGFRLIYLLCLQS